MGAALAATARFRSQHACRTDPTGRAAATAAGDAGPRPWRQGSRRDRRFRHLREAGVAGRRAGTEAPAGGRGPLSGGADPDPGCLHPAGRPGREGAGPWRGAVRLDARRCAVRPLGARRQRLYTRRLRLGCADRGAGADARTAPTGSAGAGFNASPEVARILASLVRRETRIGSGRLARSLVGSLDQDLPMLPNPERHAGFVVLKAADIPSVLVEMGFMSNPADEAELRRPQHRVRVAEAMKRAVDAYFVAAGHMA